MDKLNYIKALVPCPMDNFDCPYWDERYHKCKMLAETNTHPRDECEEFFEAEMIDAFSKKALDNLAKL